MKLLFALIFTHIIFKGAPTLSAYLKKEKDLITFQRSKVLSFIIAILLVGILGYITMDFMAQDIGDQIFYSVIGSAYLLELLLLLFDREKYLQISPNQITVHESPNRIKTLKDFTQLDIASTDIIYLKNETEELKINLKSLNIKPMSTFIINHLKEIVGEEQVVEITT